MFEAATYTDKINVYDKIMIDIKKKTENTCAKVIHD